MPSVRIRITWGRFFLGLGVITLGASIAGFAYFSQTPSDGVALSRLHEAWSLLGSFVAFLAGFGGIVAGSAILYTAPQQVCSDCSCELENYKTNFPSEVYDKLVGWIQEASPRALTEIRSIPHVGSDNKNVAAIEYSVCPRCRRIGWLIVSKLKFDERKSAFIPFESSESFLYSGETLEQFIRIAETRELHGQKASRVAA